MGVKATLTDRIGWRIVDNTTDEKSIDGSSMHTLKLSRKIKRRTRALNIELKRFASLKSYDRYVKIKTDILRNITDNEDTDEDTHTYDVEMEFRRNSSMSPLLRMNAPSADSSNLDSIHDTDSINFKARKRKEKTRHMDKVEYYLSETPARRNWHLNRKESVKDKVALIKNSSETLRNRDWMQEKDLINVKRNLTFVSENLKDNTDGIYESLVISPIGQSTRIHDENSNDGECDNIESYGAVNDESLQNSELQDLEQCHDDFTDDAHVESDDKQLKILDEVMEEAQEVSVSDGILTKKSQPIITSTEIVKTKYTIVRDEGKTLPVAEANMSLVEYFSPQKSQFSSGKKFLMDDKPIELNELSPESRRIGQLKRINLISNSSDSEGDDDDGPVDTEKNDVSLGSTRIDEYEESYAEIDDLERLPQSPPSPSSSSSSSCSSQIINDPLGSDELIANADETNTDKISLENMIIASVNKSMRCQIREQQHFQSSMVSEKIEETMDEKKRKKKKNYLEAELDVSSSTSRANIDDSKREDRDSASEREIEHSTEEITSRPIKLCEFIDREGLVLNQELSTITAKDFNECAQQNDDEEIWLMEIPKSIITDGDELYGKKMEFERGKMTINDTTYKTTCKNESSVSCILRSGRNKGRYKTVNMEPVGCIVVRQEFSDKTDDAASSPSSSHNEQSLVKTDAITRQFRSIVPFPKNLKSRDPLLCLNGIEDLSTIKDTREILESKETRKRIRNFIVSNEKRKISKKSIKKFWHVDNFVLNRKKEAT